jgi:opacity protein-like surface antigen
MRRMSRPVAVATLFTLVLASEALAQRRTVAGYQPISHRREVRPVVQQPAATTTGPDWSVAAGIASGDDYYDLGLGVGGTGRWLRTGWPVAIRGDGYFAHHSGDFDAVFGGIDISLNLFALLGSAEYTFPTEGRIKPYVFGGLGLAYANVSVDADGDLGDADDSETDLAFGVGGGARFTSRFGAELRLMDAGGFTTIPILAVLYF